MVTDPADIARQLELSDERDKWERLVLDADHRAYASGFADGYAAACRELDEDWRRTPLSRVSDSPTLTELERRRWGPGGRLRFADPRPTDYRPTDISGHDAMRSA